MSQDTAHAEALRDGNALQEAGRFAEAVACYDRALRLKPDYVEAHRNRGNALKHLGRLLEAVASYDRAIALRPNAAAYTNRGNVLRQLRRTEEALQSYERALGLNPKYAEIHNNRGSTLQELGRFEEAAESYRRAIALKPDYPEAYSNLGVALTELGRFDEAIAACDKAVGLKSDYAEAIWNRGLTRLLIGQYASGWRDYEARKRKRVPVGEYTHSKALWLGDAAISGKTILVYSEQGFGDTIQFSRYVKLLADAGAKVLFAPQSPLKSLMETLDPRVRIVDPVETLPEFDFHCPLLSLPLAFGTEPRTIPSTRAYVHVDREKENAWHGVLGEKTKPFVGVAWRGNSEQTKDRARSMDFRRFSALLDDRFQFVSLQRDVSNEDRSSLAAADIIHFGADLGDFANTAALCSLMDLVISTDTVTAHLAGALGLPVWVLLHHVPDWRWMLDRSDSPWYPTMTLFRQQEPGAWDEVLRRVRSELAARFDRWPAR